ncbi:MAG: hypothetical protein NWE95_11715, partial [Candidatus Bathyarchaeota archaeon]|nr:hypothetical protein [Candidatus Bathyarchaeota archaeon]
MNDALKRRLLSIIMDFIHESGYRDLDSFASKIAEAYVGLLTEAGNVTLDGLLKEVSKVRTSFFKANSLTKADFTQALHRKLSQNDFSKYLIPLKFDVAKNFIVANFEIGVDKNKFVTERKEILSK